MVGLFNSGTCEALARRRWYIYVSVSALPRQSLGRKLYLTIQSPLFASSWEFFTTLDHEWNVFRGHHPYRWTIWVCSLFSGFVTAHPQPRIEVMYYRSTPLRACPLFWP